MNKTLQNVIVAALLVLVQVFLINNIQLRGLLNSFVAPSVYIVFVLLMPLGTSQVRLLLTAFALGLAVDMLTGTLGVNTAACVLVAFLRPTALKLLLTREEHDKDTRPSLYVLGWTQFLLYTLLLTFVFHLALCVLEVFNFYELFFTILRALVSAIASTLIVVIFELLFEEKDKRYR